MWSALGRLGSYSTGVGKHVINMASGLAGTPGWDIRLVLTSDLHAKESLRIGFSRMDTIPEVTLPLNRRTLEALWRVVRRPDLERWIGDTDWVYCPKELYLPVREAHYAVTVHDLYHIEPEFRQRSVSAYYRKRLLERTLHEADLVLAVSDFTKRRIVELINVDSAKIRVVGNGVEDRFFSSESGGWTAGSCASSQPYILSIGGITRKKGAVHLLAVAAELARVQSQITLVVVGPVDPEFASRLADASNVRVLHRGFSDSAMHQLLRNAAVLMILSEYEGFGIPALEAMAAGVPVVAADRAALPEVVDQAGVLVEPSSSEEVIYHLLNLLNDMEVRSSLIAKGRARADRFRWNISVDRLRLAFEEFSGHAGSIATS